MYIFRLQSDKVLSKTVLVIFLNKEHKFEIKLLLIRILQDMLKKIIIMLCINIHNISSSRPLYT